MHELTIPLLAKDVTSSACCPNCGRGFERGFAYFSGGALLLSEGGQDNVASERLLGFLNIGFHGKDSDMRDSSDANVVDDVIAGQFELCWCSITCMRSWLNRLLDQIENRLPLS